MANNAKELEARCNALKTSAASKVAKLASAARASTNLEEELIDVIAQLKSLQGRFQACTRNSNIGSAAFCEAIDKTIEDLEKAKKSMVDGPRELMNLMHWGNGGFR